LRGLVAEGLGSDQGDFGLDAADALINRSNKGGLGMNDGQEAITRRRFLGGAFVTGAAAAWPAAAEAARHRKARHKRDRVLLGGR
jgi:hypothetical protein